MKNRRYLIHHFKIHCDRGRNKPQDDSRLYYSYKTVDEYEDRIKFVFTHNAVTINKKDKESIDSFLSNSSIGEYIKIKNLISADHGIVSYKIGRLSDAFEILIYSESNQYDLKNIYTLYKVSQRRLKNTLRAQEQR